MTTRVYALFAAPAAAAAIGLAIVQAAGQAKRPPTVIPPAYSGEWRSAVGSLLSEKWSDYGIHCIASVPGRGVVLAGVNGKGLFASSNQGVTWTKLGADGQCGGRLQHVTFDPDNSDVFWTTFIYGADIYKTRDGGRTLESLRTPGGETISVDFSDPDRRTLVTADHERNNTIALSVSSGRSWHSLAEHIPPGAELMPNPVLYGDNTILAASASQSRPGIYRSTDAGRSWLRVSPIAISVRHARLGRKPGSIYWTGLVGGFVRSLDGGKSWDFLGGPILEPPVELVDGTLVSYGKTSLYRSSDGGIVWRPFGPPLPFEPVGFEYNDVQHTYYISHMTKTTDRTGIMRWSP